MTFTTRRERIEAEKAAKLALRSQRSKRFSLGVAGLATAASASLFGMAPANAAIEDVPAPAASSSSTNQSAGTYTVKSGDTLSSIANSQGVSLSALMSDNNVSGSTIIYPVAISDHLRRWIPVQLRPPKPPPNGAAPSQGDRTGPVGCSQLPHPLLARTPTAASRSLAIVSPAPATSRACHGRQWA